MSWVVSLSGKRLLKTEWQQHLLPYSGAPTGKCLLVRVTRLLAIVLDATPPKALTYEQFMLLSNRLPRCYVILLGSTLLNVLCMTCPLTDVPGLVLFD